MERLKLSLYIFGITGKLLITFNVFIDYQNTLYQKSLNAIIIKWEKLMIIYYLHDKAKISCLPKPRTVFETKESRWK